MPIKTVCKFITINDEEDWKKVKIGYTFSYKCKECGEIHTKLRYNSSMDMKRCMNTLRYHNKETPFVIRSEEDWKKVKTGWHISYICNKCGKKHIKFTSDEKEIKNDCYIDMDKISFLPYHYKEMPFKINEIYDWVAVQPGWYVKYKCPICNKNHIRKILNKKDKGAKCIK